MAFEISSKFASARVVFSSAKMAISCSRAMSISFATLAENKGFAISVALSTRSCESFNIVLIPSNSPAITAFASCLARACATDLSMAILERSRVNFSYGASSSPNDFMILSSWALFGAKPYSASANSATSSRDKMPSPSESYLSNVCLNSSSFLSAFTTRFARSLAAIKEYMTLPRTALLATNFALAISSSLPIFSQTSLALRMRTVVSLSDSVAKATQGSASATASSAASTAAVN
mmetsp:Transcript_111905/g.316224  ORF Transcript_111905/g.316224 Transcript_111905/m.316224 type:complete len:236 (+) Transcript_111905:976-1683(+)